MLALSRPPDCSSPLPSRMVSPSPSSRATSARVVMLTMAARSFASSPSERSGNARYTRSVTTSPSTASPRNSSRSLVVGTLCSNANDRWVRAASRRAACLNRIPMAFSNGVCLRGTRTGRSLTPPRPQAPANRLVQRGEGYGQDAGFADHLFQVDASLGADRIFVVIRPGLRAEHFLHLEVEGLVEALQTAGAGQPHHSRHRPGDQH